MVKVDYPLCFNSSGYTVFTGRRSSQKCDCCNGTGYIGQGKYDKLKIIYGGLIK